MVSVLQTQTEAKPKQNQFGSESQAASDVEHLAMYCLALTAQCQAHFKLAAEIFDEINLKSPVPNSALVELAKAGKQLCLSSRKALAADKRYAGLMYAKHCSKTTPTDEARS